jgi:hypothetical protein
MNQLGPNCRYFVRYGIESWIGDTEDEPGHVFQIEGVVLCSTSDDDDGTVCGRLRAYVLRTEEMMEGGRFDRDAWADEDELDDVATTVYTSNGDWADGVKTLWSDIDSMDVFVLEEISLEKPHRKAGLGLAIADRTISAFGRGCGLVVISPWPTEVQNRGDEEEAKIAHRKIGKYSERLGFRPIPGTDMWARSLEHKMTRDAN